MNNLTEQFGKILSEFNEKDVRGVKMRLLDGQWEIRVSVKSKTGDFLPYKYMPKEDKWYRLP